MTFHEIVALIAEIEARLPSFVSFRIGQYTRNKKDWMIRVATKHGTFTVEPEEGDTPEELATLIQTFASDLSVASRFEKTDGDRIAELERQVESLKRKAGIYE